MVLNKKYIIFGIIGCLCFGIGDWLLGYVDPTRIEGNVFYFIRAGHSAGYDISKAAVSIALAMVGMCFLIPGFVHISDIAKKEKTKRYLKYTLLLASAGWLALHILVSVNVIVFSQADKIGGRELAVTLSENLANTGIGAVIYVYLFVGVSLILLFVDILRQKTCLKRSAAIFSPLVPLGVIYVVSFILPQSPFSYGLYTFCMNGGMIVWLGYLLCVNRKCDRSVKNDCDREM